MSNSMKAKVQSADELVLSRPELSVLSITKQYYSKTLEKCKGKVEMRPIIPKGLKEIRGRKPIFVASEKLSVIQIMLLNQKGYNVLVSAATRKYEKGDKDSVYEIPVFWADVDQKAHNCDKPTLLKKIKEISEKTGLKPTVIIDSGNGYHLIFLLDVPFVIKTKNDLEKVESLLRGLASLFGGDSCWDGSRLLRAPGTYNLKDLSNPKLVTIVQSDYNVTYKLEDFKKYAKPVELKNVDSNFKLDEIPEEIPDRFLESLDRDKELKLVWEGKKKLKDISGSAKDIALAHALKNRGYKAEEVARIIMSAPYKKENERSTNYISRTLSKVFEKEQENGDEKYFVGDDGCLYKNHTTKEGVIPKRLASFNAEIVKEVIQDDGAEKKHIYQIQGYQKSNVLPILNVYANTFSSMSWVSRWGAKAIIEPGYTVKDNLRFAIQIQSSPQIVRSYMHTGWRRIGGEQVYLSSGGGVGAQNINVNLSDELKRYCLPHIPENEIEAIKASFDFIGIGKRSVTIPLFAITFLAPMTTLLEPMPNFSGYIFGETGVFKSTIALLMLAHFGNFNSITNLSNFSDTSNSIMRTGFILKDTLLILDDYHPSNMRAEAQQKESIAQASIRSFSNRTGKGRLNPDATEKPRLEPRGMLVITGEEIPSLQSTLARIFIVEMEKGDIAIDSLSKLQDKADLLPHAMSSYLLWIKNNLPKIQNRFELRFNSLRKTLSQKGYHPKLAEQVAFLQFAFENALLWMKEKGVLSQQQVRLLKVQAFLIFKESIENHRQRIIEDDPVNKFIDVFKSLLTQGKVRLERKDGTDIVDSASEKLVGYFDDAYVYLLPELVWNNIEEFLSSEGSHFPISRNAFYEVLKKRKLIQTGKGGYTSSNVRIGSKNPKVIRWIGTDLME